MPSSFRVPSCSPWMLLLPFAAVVPAHGATEANADPATILAPSALRRMTVEELLAQEVISATRRPEEWSQVASNIFLVRGQAEHSIGATVLPQLLRLATPLFVAQKSSSEWAINTRGFVRTNGASNKLLVTVDGRTVYSPLFSNVFWESTSVFLPDLETIEVISGPAGSTWGSNAVNGVVSIRSKSARDTLGSLVFADAGSDVSRFGARTGIRLGDKGAVRVYLQGAEHEATRSAAGLEDDADPWRSLQGGFRADWGSAGTGDFSLQSDLFAGRYENEPGNQTTSDTFNVIGRWSRDLTPDSRLWIRAFHDYSRRNTQDLMVEVSHTTDLEFQHEFAFGKAQSLLWGGNYRLMEDSIYKTVNFAVLPPELDFALGSLFAQHQITFDKVPLKLISGVRIENNYFSGWETQPSVRLAWTLPDQLVWIAASRAARIPSRLDAGFFAPEDPPYFVTGGPDFQAETVNAYELGWRGQPVKSVSLTATVYLHEYDHLRSVEPNPLTVLPYTVANMVAGRSYGIELFSDWDLRSWWRLRAGGFHMNQETWRKPGSADTEGGLGEASFPEYQAQLRNTFYLGSAITWWTSVRHVAKVPAFEGGGGTVPAYSELDMGLTWKVRPGMDFSTSARNLLQPSHAEIGGATSRREIARSVQASLRLTF